MDIDLSMPAQREITPGRWVQYETMGSTTPDAYRKRGWHL